MADLQWYQLVLIALTFVWSGFVRSGLGFGGSVLSLPFMLLVYDQPLFFLPVICIHLLVFAGITVFQNQRRMREHPEMKSTVDWRFLRKAMVVMIVPKLIGVFGLITLPAHVLSVIIFTIVSVYSFTYILDRPFKSNNRVLDILFLVLGAYMSGTSLIGGPLLIAVFAGHVAKEQLRDTLFMLWYVLVLIKLSAFIYAGVNLQLIHQLWLLPAAGIGHLLGLRLHRKLQQTDPKVFYRLLGVVLLISSGAGLIKGLA